VFVEVDLGRRGSRPRLVEPEDFRAFKLLARGAEDERALDDALGELGRVVSEGGHAWLSVDGLRALAGDRTEEQDWNDGFNSMVSYAQARGWLSSEGGEIRAHIEWA
jgi:hypothetical protein